MQNSSKKVVIYHNCKCSKSRATLDIVQKSGVEFSIVNYLETPPSADEVLVLCMQLGMRPAQLVRTGEDRYEELGLDKNPPATDKAWAQILSDNPILIERPIVTDGERAVIGRPPEKVLQLLK